MRLFPGLSIGALSLWSSAVAAQESVPQRRLNIDAQAVATYESNFLKLPRSVRASEPRDDLRYNAGLTLDFQMPVGRQSVFLTATTGYDFHLRNEDLDNERIQVRGGGDLRGLGCGAKLSGDYIRGQSDFADILTGERIANVEVRTFYVARVTCGSNNGLRPGVAIEHEDVENQGLARADGNYASTAYTAGIGFARPQLGELTLNTTYKKGRYKQRLVGFGPRDAVESHSIGLTFRREIGSQLTGYATFGYTRVNPNLPGVRDYKGLAYSADLTWTPGTRMQVSVSASRDAQQSNLLSISYSIVDSYTAGVNYALGDRLQLTMVGNHTKRRLRDSPLTAGPVLNIEDRATRLSAGARFAASRRINLSLDAAAEQRRSDNPLFEYNNLSVALTTRLSV